MHKGASLTFVSGELVIIVVVIRIFLYIDFSLTRFIYQSKFDRYFITFVSGELVTKW